MWTVLKLAFVAPLTWTFPYPAASERRRLSGHLQGRGSRYILHAVGLVRWSGKEQNWLVTKTYTYIIKHNIYASIYTPGVRASKLALKQLSPPASWAHRHFHQTDSGFSSTIVRLYGCHGNGCGVFLLFGSSCLQGFSNDSANLWANQK